MALQLPCMCASTRRASRALTQMYDDSLRPLGLHATQFSILQALELAGEVSQNQLSNLLFIDSTTLTRNLRILRKKGWIAVRAGADRRERWLRLAPLGWRQLQRATPVWEGVQRELRHKLGDVRWRDLQKLSSAIVDIVANSRTEGVSNDN
ncbi:MAG TPA: MarR family winged helix-turn-helix transcriptional regulator [Terriglobales bacterium]|nr:MarR family winged helix-turn-helix transcriptional regulator [Terriglobales bacterium]